jgi:hypothetical protein
LVAASAIYPDRASKEGGEDGQRYEQGLVESGVKAKVGSMAEWVLYMLTVTAFLVQLGGF